MLIYPRRGGNLRIIVLRHTEKCLAKGLTKKGRLQAKRAAKKLKEQGICRIYYSPALRTKKTARLVNQSLSVPTVERNLLADVEFSGSLSTLQEISLNWQEIWLSNGFGFEDSDQFIQRVETCLGKIILENNPESTVLIVAHEETIWAMQSILNGVTFKETTKHNIPYASIYIFNIDQYKLRSIFIFYNKNFKISVPTVFHKLQIKNNKLPYSLKT